MVNRLTYFNQFTSGVGGGGGGAGDLVFRGHQPEIGFAPLASPTVLGSVAATFVGGAGKVVVVIGIMTIVNAPAVVQDVKASPAGRPQVDGVPKGTILAEQDTIAGLVLGDVGRWNRPIHSVLAADTDVGAGAHTISMEFGGAASVAPVLVATQFSVYEQV